MDSRTCSYKRNEFEYSLRLDNSSETLLLEAESCETMRVWQKKLIPSEIRFSTKTFYEMLSKNESENKKLDSGYKIIYPDKVDEDNNLIIVIEIKHELEEFCGKVQIKLEPVEIDEIELLKKQVNYLLRENKRLSIFFNDITKRMDDLETKKVISYEQHEKLEIEPKDKSISEQDFFIEIKEDYEGGLKNDEPEIELNNDEPENELNNDEPEIEPKGENVKNKEEFKVYHAPTEMEKKICLIM